MDEGNFRIRSFEYGGGGVIVVERINKKFVKENAHMYATGYGEQTIGRVFQASNSGFLTSANQRLIVQYPENY